MQTFSYTAISANGEKISGEESAENEKDLGRILREKGYIVTTVRQAEKKWKLPSLEMLTSLFQGVSATDKLLFTRNLQVMVSAGIPLPKTLDVLAAQTKNSHFQKTLIDIKKRVMKGRSLSEAMEAHREYIMGETLALSLVSSDSLADENAEEFSLGSETLQVALSRA